MRHCYIRLLAAVIGSAIVATGSAAHAADDATAKFFRGLNLNGPPVTIDGHLWEGKESPNYTCQDKAFETQTVNLLPSTSIRFCRQITTVCTEYLIARSTHSPELNSTKSRATLCR